MPDSSQFYINGAWVEPSAGATRLDVINPSTEEPCAVIALGAQEDTDRAVAAARAAFEGWALTDPAERFAALERLLEAYKARRDDMVEAISQEMGAPVDLARQQQVSSGDFHLEALIAQARDFDWHKPLGPQAESTMLLYQPVGVCALITPWNWPMNQVTLKVAPALLAGCTMVLKPSEIAPLSSLVFSEMVDAADIPPGVFNMVNGDGAGVGSQLSAHPDVDMVSFTGSTRAGRLISKSAADTIKRVSLELGGKGANMIFESANEKAAKRGAIRCFNNSGQSCNAPTRMLVQRDRYEDAVAMAVEAAEATAVGPASEAGRHIGPVVSELQYDKIQDLIQSGIDEGARLVAGGTGRPEHLNRGYFVRPTVFADVTPDMRIYREEIFGPVLSIMPFDTEEEAIEIANDTDYGLTNYIQTEDKDQLRRVATRVRSGMVESNSVSLGAGSPFGGFKQSGNGREGGLFGLHEFLEVKAVSDWI
ncbi:MAG: aldehyde dehydrogenase family protein [Pseudomonadota bacterium]